ncbi:hypothetical protein Vadar_034037 [Vaccinium darrowii]|uniref:Uncharacterized protein n=1 Tax=Vaccinium darrowii TaxID=229202 RepID=A0ACB7YJ40_9ERIC|nr:hypothetical protein Vadar_034037 [Vaccinium darrowii]
MENPIVLLCKQGDSSFAVVLSHSLSFDCLVTVSSRIGRIDVVVKESIGSCLGVIVDDGLGSSVAVVAVEVISDVGDGDMISSFCLYPLCLAVVNSENSENWLWFMHKLRDFFDWDREIVFISDWHETLLRSVESVFPASPHSYCLVHLKANLSKHTGGLETKRMKHIMALFHRCAYAPTVVEFDKLLSKLKADGGAKVIEFLSNLANEHWCHPYFVGKRYAELTSNLVESFNSWIKKESRLPITQLVDRIGVKLMDQMSDRRDLGLKWKIVI